MPPRDRCAFRIPHGTLRTPSDAPGTPGGAPRVVARPLAAAWARAGRSRARRRSRGAAGPGARVPAPGLPAGPGFAALRRTASRARSRGRGVAPQGAVLRLGVRRGRRGQDPRGDRSPPAGGRRAERRDPLPGPRRRARGRAAAGRVVQDAGREGTHRAGPRVHGRTAAGAGAATGTTSGDRGRRCPRWSGCGRRRPGSTVRRGRICRSRWPRGSPPRAWPSGCIATSTVRSTSSGSTSPRFPAPPERRRQGEVRFHLHDGTVVEWGRTDRDLDGVAGEDSYADEAGAPRVRADARGASEAAHASTCASVSGARGRRSRGCGEPGPRRPRPAGPAAPARAALHGVRWRRSRDAGRLLRPRRASRRLLRTGGRARARRSRHGTAARAPRRRPTVPRLRCAGDAGPRGYAPRAVPGVLGGRRGRPRRARARAGPRRGARGGVPDPARGRRAAGGGAHLAPRVGRRIAGTDPGPARVRARARRSEARGARGGRSNAARTGARSVPRRAATRGRYPAGEPLYLVFGAGGSLVGRERGAGTFLPGSEVGEIVSAVELDAYDAVDRPARGVGGGGSERRSHRGGPRDPRATRAALLVGPATGSRSWPAPLGQALGSAGQRVGGGLRGRPALRARTRRRASSEAGIREVLATTSGRPGCARSSRRRTRPRPPARGARAVVGSPRGRRSAGHPARVYVVVAVLLDLVLRGAVPRVMGLVAPALAVALGLVWTSPADPGVRVHAVAFELGGGGGRRLEAVALAGGPAGWMGPCRYRGPGLPAPPRRRHRARTVS